MNMRIIAKRTLKEFWEKHPSARGALSSWYHEVSDADWRNPHDIKSHYRSADFLPENRVVFNIGGNKYRLVVKVNYEIKIVYIRFIGTHKEYDRINAKEV